MSEAAEALRHFLEQTEGGLVAVAVAAIGSDGGAHTMFVSGNKVFPLVGASAYLHHRLLTEAIEPHRSSEIEARGPHQVTGEWIAPQPDQRPSDD